MQHFDADSWNDDDNDEKKENFRRKSRMFYIKNSF